jgi:EAL and modified HD-GYP domain-containing signal transduction protein
VLVTPPDEAAALAARLRPLGITLVAEKVECREIYDRMREAGYSLFQGFYFCRPAIQTGTAIPPRQLVYVRLLAALNKPDIGTLELETLVKQDVSLSLRVLRFVNSAAVPIRTEVHTIGQALFLIGMEPIRKWASVWCLAGLNAGATPELATLALVRARSCELIGETLPDVDAAELFLVGLCSLLDAMLGRRMREALDQLPLSSVVTNALLGQPSRARAVLDAVVAYEGGAWKAADQASRRAGMDPATLPAAYTGALRWSQDIVRGGITEPLP